jgi:hypothetical protein
MPTLASPFSSGRSWSWASGTLLVLMAALLGSWMLPAAASAARSVSFAAGFSPGGLLGPGLSYSSELTFSGSEYHGHVDPLTGLTVHLPAGIGVSSVGFPTCAKTTLEQSGSSACPAGSLAGPVGSVTALFPLGSETLEDKGTVQAVFGPSATLYFALEAGAPVPLKLVAEGRYVSDSAPYGQDLVLSVPTIGSVPGAPDMSITALTLHVGIFREEGGAAYESVSYPSSCPSGKFAWASDAAFNGEAAERVGATETPCNGSEEPPKHQEEETANKPPATSSTTGSTTSSGGGGSSSGGSTPPVATISSAQIVASLAGQLVPSGRAAKIAALLKAGGLTMSFTALEAGTFTVQWYELPSGAKIAKKAKSKPVLVASGQASFSGAGVEKVRIRLTAQGRKLLKHGKTVKVEAKGVFVPEGGAGVDVTRTIELRG